MLLWYYANEVIKKILTCGTRQKKPSLYHISPLSSPPPICLWTVPDQPSCHLLNLLVPFMGPWGITTCETALVLWHFINAISVLNWWDPPLLVYHWFVDYNIWYDIIVVQSSFWWLQWHVFYMGKSVCKRFWNLFNPCKALVYPDGLAEDVCFASLT